MENNKTLQITPSSSSLGAKISGIDLNFPLSESVVKEIKDVWFDRGVVSFPDQNLSPSALENFTLAIGDYGATDFIVPMEDHPNVLELRREPQETASHFGASWHSDYSFQESPPAATILFAHIVPPVGGDTLFADGRAAYLALSKKMQDFLDDLKGIHSAALPYAKDGFFGTDDDPSRTLKIIPSDRAKECKTHPIIRTHPDTGEKILWLSSNYTLGIEGLHENESKVLLSFLCDFSTREEFVYRHKWQKNMLIMWDNRRVQHFADGGFDGHRRVMWRTTVAGSVPV